MRVWHRRQRAGMALVYVSMTLCLVVGFCSVGVEWGRMQLIKTQLYRAGDAAARAAMTEFQNGNGTAAARTAAVTVAGQNTADGTSVVIDPNLDVEFGTYDDTTDTFTKVTGAAEANATAIHVICSRTAARGNASSLTFAKIVGMSSCDVTTDSVITTDAISAYNIVGINSLTVDNVDIDSFDSSVGPYGPGNTRGNAALASGGPVTLKNSSHIHSECHPGNGYSITKDALSQIDATAPYNSGSNYPIQSPATASITSALNYPVDSPGNYATTNDNANLSTYIDGSGNFSYTPAGNRTVTIPGGTYCFNSMTTSSKVTLNCTGPVTIYVAGNVSLDGKINTYQTDTHNFLLKVYGAGTLSLTWNSAFYGSVYAPLSDVTLNSGPSAFYGAIIGKTLSLRVDKLHYDESLASNNNGGPSVKNKHHKHPKHYH